MRAQEEYEEEKTTITDILLPFDAFHKSAQESSSNVAAHS